MNKEKLQAFAEAVSKSEELQKRFNSIQMETVRSTAEKLAKLSESAGTPFTAEEYLQSVIESSEELSAEQLQTVSGGVDDDSARAAKGVIQPGKMIWVVVGDRAKITLDDDPERHQTI